MISLNISFHKWHKPNTYTLDTKLEFLPEYPLANRKAFLANNVLTLDSKSKENISSHLIFQTMKQTTYW